MARVTIEDCLKNIKNRYELVHLCTSRTRQIFRGSNPMIESDNGPVVTALREIAAGKIRFLQSPEEVKPVEVVDASIEKTKEIQKPAEEVKNPSSE